MLIASNKFAGIYATMCWNEELAKKAKMDEDVNVLVLAADFINADESKKIIKAWIESEGLNHERHMRRMGKVQDIERQNFKSP